MTKIVAVHSFRGGTGKSNTTANLSALLAEAGMRVGVVDTDIQSPGIHVLYGLDESGLSPSLNDYLYGKCSIAETAHDVTDSLGAPVKGKVLLVPSSIRASEIARVLREGYDVGKLNDGFNDLMDELSLDFLLVDSRPGMNEETLLSISISDALIIVLRPDQQDYQGTAVTLDVARKLEVPTLLLVVNKVPSVFNIADVKARIEQAYGCEVAAVLPHSEELMALASSGIFALRHRNNPVTVGLQQVAARLMAAVEVSARSSHAGLPGRHATVGVLGVTWPKSVCIQGRLEKRGGCGGR